ncbi:gamma-glutamyltransferase, partial [Cupriavidus sp. 2MCAB6]
EGGNAIEAMVAMAATIAVVYPHMNAIGGDGFWLVHEPGGKVHAIEACGPAGALATIERYREKGHDSIPSRGADAAVTVAGAVGGWQAALELAKALGGKMPVRDLLADAITHCDAGYAVSDSELRTWPQEA